METENKMNPTFQSLGGNTDCTGIMGCEGVSAPDLESIPLRLSRFSESFQGT